MKLPLSKLNFNTFQMREKIDEDYLSELTKSLECDGQWHPILVRPVKNGTYDVIEGHMRCLAAKKLGWAEIEATVKDIPDAEANILAIKTNLLRKDLSDVEIGTALWNFLKEHEGYTQERLAKDLGKSQKWISNKVAMVARISDKVKEALAKNSISFSVALEISRISPTKKEIKKLTPFYISKQNKVLDIILKWQEERKEKIEPKEARELVKLVMNDTIYTIGYSGKTKEQFLKLLKDNKIDVVVDIRSEGFSRNPQFDFRILEETLNNAKIKYWRKGEFGIPKLIREPYLKKFLSKGCLIQWYKWSLFTIPEGKKDSPIIELANKIKKEGKAVLLCSEEDAEVCHRTILAEFLLGLENKTFNKPYFEKRRDL